MQQYQAHQKQAILLDLSLFILDFLDTDKIRRRTKYADHILEVPSALVQMLLDSKVGSPMLYMFVYSLLAKTIRKYRYKEITDQRIQRLVNMADYEVRREAWSVTKNLYDEFSPLIDTASISIANKPKQESNEEVVEYPIRRYDAICSAPQNLDRWAKQDKLSKRSAKCRRDEISAPSSRPR